MIFLLKGLGYALCGGIYQVCFGGVCTLYPSPDLLYSRPAHYLGHLGKELMGIIYDLSPPEPGGIISCDDSIQINAAYDAGLMKKEIKKQPGIVFEIKELSLIEPTL